MDNTPLISCGIIIRSPQGWLLAHATRTTRWDIPKGRQEDGETPWQAAVRECFEETNLDVSDWEGVRTDLGRHPYIKGKELHVFVLDVDSACDLSDCRCHTDVEVNGQSYPETDRWAWVEETQLFSKIGKGLGELIVKLELTPAPPQNWWAERQKQDKARAKTRSSKSPSPKG